ncbi:unnamed protein product, partial [Polarella glacialis]
PTAVPVRQGGLASRSSAACLVGFGLLAATTRRSNNNNNNNSNISSSSNNNKSSRNNNNSSSSSCRGLRAGIVEYSEELVLGGRPASVWWPASGTDSKQTKNKHIKNNKNKNNNNSNSNSSTDSNSSSSTNSNSTNNNSNSSSNSSNNNNSNSNNIISNNNNNNNSNNNRIDNNSNIITNTNNNSNTNNSNNNNNTGSSQRQLGAYDLRFSTRKLARSVVGLPIGSGPITAQLPAAANICLGRGAPREVSGRCVVLVHGLLCTRLDLAHVAEALAARGFTCVAPEMDDSVSHEDGVLPGGFVGAVLLGRVDAEARRRAVVQEAVDWLRGCGAQAVGLAGHSRGGVTIS